MNGPMQFMKLHLLTGILILVVFIFAIKMKIIGIGHLSQEGILMALGHLLA